MRKLIGNASSKYSLNPEQFNKDIAEHRVVYKQKKADIKEQLNTMLISDKSKVDETFRIMLNCLKELKTKYDL